MSDLFDDFKKILKKDFLPIFVQYFKDPNSNITDTFNDFLNKPKTFAKDIFENFSTNKDIDNKQESYTDIKNVTNIDSTIDDEYVDLLKRLIVIEGNMIQIEKILKDKN